MKKFILPLIATSVLSSTAFAKYDAKVVSKDLSRDGAFVQAFGAMTFNGTLNASRKQDHDFRAGALYGIGGGYNFKDFSFSGTFDQVELVSDTYATDTLKITTLLANASYNIKTGTKLTPFVGVGLGTTLGAILSGSTGSVNLNRQFVYQIQAGAKYALCEKLDVFADVRFRNNGGTQTQNQALSNTSGNPKVGSNFFAVAAGVSYKF